MHERFFLARHLIGVLLALHLCTTDAASAPATLTSDDLGRYQVLRPPGPAKRLVFAFGNDGDPELGAAATALAGRGALVARVDVDRFATGVRDRHEQCLDVAAIVNWYANYLGRRYNLTRLEPPLLIGKGAGATLVYVLLGQAPPQTFAGGVSEFPRRTLPFTTPLCGLPGTHGTLPQELLSALPPTAPWWPVAKPGESLPAGLSAAAGNQPQPPSSEKLTQGAILAFDELTAPTLQITQSIQDLPLVEVTATTPNEALAVIYSGDGGWRDIDKTIGELLAKADIPVVGVDAVRYFWRRKTPQQTADDLTRILKHYRDAWGSRRVLLVGYSFGADSLPATFNRLPVDAQRQVAGLVLLAPARKADFEVKIAGWLGHSSADAVPTQPELRRIAPDKVLCIYGSEEAQDSLCTASGLPGIKLLQRPGGHHFDGNYPLIARAILEFFHKPADRE